MALRALIAFGLAVGSGCVVAGSGAGYVTTTPAASAVVDSEPPAPYAEPVQPRPGYVFIAGRWAWQNQWIWIAGRWEHQRAGYAWNPGRWQRHGRGWLWIEGTWVVTTSPTIATRSAGPPSAFHAAPSTHAARPVDTAPPVDAAGPQHTAPPVPPIRTSPPVTNAGAVAMLALGEGYTCSLSGAGQVRCWGFNHYGALGIGSRARSAVGTVTGLPNDVRAIAAGGYQTCALTATGHVWCWGSNIEGQVGNGSVASSETPVVKPVRVSGIDNVRSLHLGDKISCALTNDSQLYCWGSNSHHQIDDSSSQQITSPTRVRGTGRVDLVAAGNYHLCYASNGRVQCRGQIESLNRDIATLRNVTALSAGFGHSCAIHDGKVSCWGQTYHGVLGLGDQCPGHDGECTSQLRPPAVVPGMAVNPVEIAGLDYFTCVRFADGAETCFGSNQGGAFSDTLPKDPWQTAYKLPGVVADRVYVGGIHVCTVRTGVASCRGNNSEGAVGPR